MSRMSRTGPLTTFDNDGESSDEDCEENHTLPPLPPTTGYAHREPRQSKPATTTEKDFPFVLTIWIHGGTDLPVCDVRASDPYLFIYRGDAMISRTKTVYANCNPRWTDEKHVIKLLHTNCVIKMRVFDEDKHKTDEPMGDVFLDVSLMRYHELKGNVNLPLIQVPGAVKVRGNITVSYQLYRRDDLIRMDPLKAEKTLPSKVNKYVSSILDELAINLPVSNEMLHSLVLENHHLFSSHYDMITDLLYDARSLSLDQMMSELQLDSSDPRSALFEQDSPIEEVFAEVPMTVVRVIAKKTSALKLDLKVLRQGQGRKWTRTSPMEYIGIQVQFKQVVDKPVMAHLKLNNWHLQMIWTLWLSIGLDLANRKEESEWFEDLPDFISARADFFSSHVILMIDNGKDVECQCRLSLSHAPYKLLFQIPSGDCILSLNLESVSEMLISVSTFAPSKLLMKANVDTAEVFKKPSLTLPSLIVPLKEKHVEVVEPVVMKEEKKPEKRKKSFLGGLTDSVSGLTNTLQSTLLGHSSAYQAYTATSKLGQVVEKKKMDEQALKRNMPRADPTKRRVGGGFLIGRLAGKISGAITGTANAAASVVSTVTNEAQHGFKSGDAYEHFVVVKCSSRTHKTKICKGHNLEWADEEPLIDIPLEKLEETSNIPGVLNGILIFMFDSSTFGKEDFVGVKFIPYSQLVPQGIFAALEGENATGDPKLSSASSNLEVFLNDKISLTVNLESAHHLRIPNHAHPGGVYATIEFGAWNGSNLGTSKQTSASVTTTRHPVWPHGGAVMTLNAEDGLQWAEYIRLCLFDGNQVGYMPIGIAYIPMSDFEDPSKIDVVQQYMLTNRMHGSFTADAENLFGWAKVRLRATVEQGVGRSQVKINSKFYRSNEFTTTWPAEGMLLGSIAAHKENTNVAKGMEVAQDEGVAERFTVLAAYKELVLIDINVQSGESSRADYSMSGDIDQLVTGKPIMQVPLETKSDDSDVLLVRCFENERRAFTHGLAWQRLKKCGFSEVDVTKSQPFVEKEDALPPDGYEWDGDWKLDLTHHKTGEGGWIYAVDFNAMRFNLRTGINFTSPFMQSVRRRRWNRNARPLPSLLKAPLVEKKVESHVWRSEMIARTGGAPAIIGTCMERKSADHPVKIPWANVKGAHAITDTELCIFITINRYLETRSTKFCEVDAVLFVSNCCADEFKMLIDERVILAATRLDVNKVVTSGQLCEDKEEEINAWDDGSGHFEAEEMPFGSRVVTDIDGDAIFLERHLQDLEMDASVCSSLWGKSDIEKQMGKFMRRASRLRLYISTMLNAKLKGKHDYDVDSVVKIMEQDFKKAKRIGGEDEVAQANDRIEFLLDTAEMRLREAALCGWDYRGKKLERCIETLVNGYFIEMVGTMGGFFDSDVMNSVQGFGGKLEIIRTYMKHNDRLATILDSACKPYRIAPTLSPQLSYFLDVDTLIGWYAQVLQVAMVEVVDNCLAVWRDKSKGASKLTDMYEFNLPWIPDREKSRSGLFKTCIPEDAIRGLQNYILYARVKKGDIAPSFYKTLEKIDIKVHTSYVMALNHLAEQYMSALESCDWTAASAETLAKGTEEEMRQLTENFEWICSTINDSHRVISLCYCNPITLSKVGAGEWDTHILENSVADFSSKVYNSFSGTAKLGIDWLSCVIFAKVLSDKELGKLVGRSAFQAWNATVPDLLSTESEQTNSLVVELANAVAELIEESGDSLTSDHLFQLTSICTNKIMVICLTLLKLAKEAKIYLDRHGPLVLQIERDFKLVHKTFTELAQKLLQNSDVNILALRDMELAHTLITEEKESHNFKDAMSFCVKRLDVDTLIGWYAQVLQVAMVEVVDNCLAVWRDKSKGASKLTDMYEFNLPWIPDREKSRSGLFKTCIPEDAIRGLQNYILYARVKKGDIAPSFYKTLGKIDIKVHTSYVMALNHLAEQYMSALESCDWTAASAETLAKGTEEEMRQLTENFEWICSTINDSHRVISLCYCNPITLSKVGAGEWDTHILENSVADFSSKVYNSFSGTAKLGIDWLSCVIFAKVLSDKELGKLVGRSAFQAWNATVPDLLSTESEQTNSLVVELANAVAELIEESGDSLTSDHLFQLTSICANKIMVICLTLLKLAKEAKIYLDRHGPLVLQIERDFKMVHKKITELAQKLLQNSDVNILALRDMELAHTLITEEKESHNFKDAMSFCVKRSKRRPSMGGALSAFVQCCIDLRADCNPKAASKGFVTQAAGTMRRMSAMFNKPAVALPASLVEVDIEADEFKSYCRVNIDTMKAEYDECDMELRNNVLVMEPIEKAFAVDALIAKRTLKSLLVSSASIFSQSLENSVEPESVMRTVPRIVFNVLCTSQLPCVNSTRQPHCYIQFLINDRVVAESSVIKDEIRPDWSSENIVVNLSDSKRFLRCRIMVKNYIWDDIPLGYVEIPLISIDVMGNKQQSFPIDCSISPSAEAALDKMVADGGHTPKLFVSFSAVY